MEGIEHPVLFIEHPVQFIEDDPPEVWGAQPNGLVDPSLQPTREPGLDADHYRRFERAGRDG